MKQWLNMVIVVCVLLTAYSVEAGEKTSQDVLEEFKQGLKQYTDTDSIDEVIYRDFLDIKVFRKVLTRVSFMGGGNDERIGLDAHELTDYLRLKIKNNFTDIKIEELDYDKYMDKQIGYISLRVWVVGNNYPISYHLKFSFFHNDSSQTQNMIWDNEWLGAETRAGIHGTVKKCIDEAIEKLAILFYKVRGEL